MVTERFTVLDHLQVVGFYAGEKWFIHSSETTKSEWRIRAC